MRGAVVVLVLVGVLCLAACGGDEDDAANGNVAATTAPRGEPVVIRTKMDIADTERAEPIATGEVLEGSTLGDSEFCAGGTVRDSHGSSDPTVWLIVETITCPEGTVKLRFRPEPARGMKQTGSWTIFSGTGTYEGLRGSGEMEVVYGPDADSPAHVTFRGTVTR
ncbi:MAG TPA: hypothetical protein VEY87_06110 [Gaiellaceae bacterium]|nr:hypothetical protein [Gaiellaceae bacterium]